MRFTLDDETNVSREAENYLWQDTMEVEVTQGQFYTLVGGGENPFTYLAFDENSELDYMDDLYIGVDIDSGSGFVELSNSQKIVPMLSAYMTTLGEDVKVNSLRVNQFTIDSERGQGLVNLVAGAQITSSGTGYEYLGTRGSSRIMLNDGSIGMFVGATVNSGQNTGDEVTWTTGLTINNTGLLTASNATITGKTTVDEVDVGGCINFPNSEDGHYEICHGANDGTGLSVRATTNPDSENAIFRVLSSGWAERLRVEHDGKVFMDNNLEVDGDLTISGNLRANLGFIHTTNNENRVRVINDGIYMSIQVCPDGYITVAGFCVCPQNYVVATGTNGDGWHCWCRGGYGDVEATCIPEPPVLGR